MIDPKKLLADFLGSEVPGAGGTVKGRLQQGVDMAKQNPIATGAIAAVLLGTGAGRAVTGSALRLGGLAAVAGLAYTAYKNYQAGKEPAPADALSNAEPPMLPAPDDSGFHPTAAPQGEDAFALSIVRAMIAAARADGHIDDAERTRIQEKLAMAGLDDEARDFLMGELQQPVDIDAIVASAVTEEQRVELYTASRLTIEPKTRAERGYLDLLAGRLGLPDALVDHVEATVGGAKV